VRRCIPWKGNGARHSQSCNDEELWCHCKFVLFILFVKLQLNVSLAVDRSELYKIESHVLFLYRKSLGWKQTFPWEIPHIERKTLYVFVSRFFAIVLCVVFGGRKNFEAKRKKTLLVQDIIIDCQTHCLRLRGGEAELRYSSRGWEVKCGFWCCVNLNNKKMRGTFWRAVSNSMLS
jgi:hypothetical protein